MKRFQFYFKIEFGGGGGWSTCADCGAPVIWIILGLRMCLTNPRGCPSSRRAPLALRPCSGDPKPYSPYYGHTLNPIFLRMTRAPQAARASRRGNREGW